MAAVQPSHHGGAFRPQRRPFEAGDHRGFWSHAPPTPSGTPFPRSDHLMNAPYAGKIGGVADFMNPYSFTYGKFPSNHTELPQIPLERNAIYGRPGMKWGQVYGQHQR